MTSIIDGAFAASPVTGLAHLRRAVATIVGGQVWRDEAALRLAAA